MIDFKLLQLRKAPSSIIFIVDGSVTFSSLLQLSKNSYGTSVTPSLNSTSFNLSNFTSSPERTMSIFTLSFIINLVIGEASAHDGVNPFNVVFSGISQTPELPIYAKILFVPFA